MFLFPRTAGCLPAPGGRTAQMCARFIFIFFGLICRKPLRKPVLLHFTNYLFALMLGNFFLRNSEGLFAKNVMEFVVSGIAQKVKGFHEKGHIQKR